MLTPEAVYVWFSDGVRFYVVITAMLLLAMTTRSLIGRLRGTSNENADPFLMLGTSGMLTLAIARRFERLGEPADGWLWAAVVVVTVFGVGMLRTYHVRVVPPWLRRDRARRSGGHSAT